MIPIFFLLFLKMHVRVFKKIVGIQSKFLWGRVNESLKFLRLSRLMCVILNIMEVFYSGSSCGESSPFGQVEMNAHFRCCRTLV